MNRLLLFVVGIIISPVMRGETVCAFESRELSFLDPCNYQERQPTRDEGLARAGYTNDIPMSKAVDDFNRRAHRNIIGKTQPPLTVKEVIAAIRGWNRDVDLINDSAFQVFQAIAKSKIMPRGSFIRFIPGLVAINGYDVDVWWIDLQIGLDKYPTDLADVPMYARRVRTTYVGSKPHSMK